jgi:hypothetical protein
MIGPRQRQFDNRQEVSLPPCMQRAVVQLAEAHDYACDAQADPWQYAVEIESLLELGATGDDLQALVQDGFVVQAREVTRIADTVRRFATPRGSDFTKRTCFVLTDAGLQLTSVTSAPMPRRRAA